MSRRILATVSCVLLATAGCGDDASSDPEGSSSSGGASTSSTSGVGTSPDTESGGSSGDTDPGGFLDVYDIVGDEVFPEGVAFDPVGEAFFIGSLSDGTVRRVDVQGNQTDFAAAPDGSWASSGLKVDGDNGRVWVCATEADASTSNVWHVNLSDGALVEAIDLAAVDPGATCNDLTLGPDGAVYVSAPPIGAVVRVTAGGQPELFASLDAWAPQLGGLGVNGLAVTPDGTALIQGFFLPAALFRVSLDNPADITEVSLSGDPFAGENPISGVDGIVFDDGALYVTFAEVVKRIDFNEDWTTGTVSTFDVPGAGNGLSTATTAGGAVYVVKSEVTAFVLGDTPELPFQIIKVPGT